MAEGSIEPGTVIEVELSASPVVHVEITGAGPRGPQGERGAPGPAGEAGISPAVAVADIPGGHRVTVTDAGGTHAFDVLDGSGSVSSVNGKTGNVILEPGDIGALPDTYKAPVSSVNGKTGAVTLTAADVYDTALGKDQAAVNAGAIKCGIATWQGETTAGSPVTQRDISYYTEIPDVSTRMGEIMEEAENGIRNDFENGIVGRNYYDILKYYYALVNTNGTYDIKEWPEFQNYSLFSFNGEIVSRDVLGNVLAGYLARVCNIGNLPLRIGAGYNQIRNGTSQWEWFFNFGDDPRDTKRIKEGIEIYKQTH